MSATCTLEVAKVAVIIALLAVIGGFPNRWDGRARDMVTVRWTSNPGASQLRPRRLHLLLLELKGLLKPKLQCTSTEGGRSIRNVSDVLFHESDCLLVLEVRNKKITLHLHDLLLAERTRQFSVVCHMVERKHRTHPAVAHEKISLTTFSEVTLLLMSAEALSRRGWIPSLITCVRVWPETSH